MNTLVLLEITAKAGSLDDVIEFFRTVLPDTRSYEGCQDLNVYVNEDDRTIVQVQHWDSVEHYQKYLAWRVETGVLSGLVSMLEGDPSIRFFQSTDV